MKCYSFGCKNEATKKVKYKSKAYMSTNHHVIHLCDFHDPIEEANDDARNPFDLSVEEYHE